MHYKSTILLTRRHVFQHASALSMIGFGSSVDAAVFEFEKFDPFLPPQKHYSYISRYIWDLELAGKLVNALWDIYSKTGNKKYADWCFIYWYNYWRLVPLGAKRVKTAQIGARMAERVLKKHGRTAWNVFWYAAFIGLESISRGVLNAAQLLPEFQTLMLESADIDAKEYYANASLGLAKLYIKAPPFPVSVGDIDKGWKYLKISESHQRKKFALWYLFAAEAYLTSGQKAKMHNVLDSIKTEVKPPDVASQIILETTLVDAENLREVVVKGEYNKYSWDPMFTPLKLNGR